MFCIFYIILNMVGFETFEHKLRSAGQSVTKTRRAVFAALENQEPLSMHELIRKLPGVDAASVYRSINVFERLGIVQRLQTGWKYKLELTDDFHEHHHHATCLNCNKSFILPDALGLETIVEGVTLQIGFAITRHQLEVQGYCSSCAAKATA